MDGQVHLINSAEGIEVNAYYVHEVFSSSIHKNIKLLLLPWHQTIHIPVTLMVTLILLNRLRLPHPFDCQPIR